MSRPAFEFACVAVTANKVEGAHAIRQISLEFADKLVAVDEGVGALTLVCPRSEFTHVHITFVFSGGVVIIGPVAVKRAIFVLAGVFAAIGKGIGALSAQIAITIFADVFVTIGKYVRTPAMVFAVFEFTDVFLAARCRVRTLTVEGTVLKFALVKIASVFVVEIGAVAAKAVMPMGVSLLMRVFCVVNLGAGWQFVLCAERCTEKNQKPP